METNVKRDTVVQSAALGQRLAQHVPGARLQLQELPDTEGLCLYLLNADYPQADLSPEQVQAILDYPAYWAFCWASGQVLASFIARHPEWVASRRVLDFGCGSGVAGIAAARAGAAEVVACDIDADALAATALNADYNGVQLSLRERFDDCEGPFDLVLAADVLYDRANLPWLARFLQRAPRVLLADSRIRDFAEPGYRKLGEWPGNTFPDLDESAEFRRVSVYAGSTP
ncbi:MAG: 50S ribosomal protein L11 methyltransferase [Halieaceae bacterium]|nr:50S ribosomal protein L11 methyltransferase [Halieaceae bacterium]